jgi:hypothetical protein
MLPIMRGGTVVRRRTRTCGCMPSRAVRPAAGWWTNCASRLVALLPQAPLEADQLLAIEVVDGGMVRRAHHLELCMAEQRAF